MRRGWGEEHAQVVQADGLCPCRRLEPEYTTIVDTKIVVASYSILQTRSASARCLQKFRFKCVIADESHNLKEKNSKVVMQKVNRLAKKLKELWDRFRTEGPSSEAKSLEEGLTSLSIFRSQLEAIDKQIIELNDYQKVLKMPLTDFEVFTILRTEFENLEEIYKVFQELQNTTSRIEELTCDIYFAAPDKFSLSAVEKEVEELKARFGDHVVLQKLEAKMKSFASYQRIIYLLNNDKLRPRHWEILLQRTGVQTEDEYMSFQLNLFLHLEQSEFESVIVDVIDIAQEEARIEEELTAIRLRWEERKFILH